MSTVLSLPEELVIKVLLKGDHRMLLTCQRVRDWLYPFLELFCNASATTGLPHAQRHNQEFSCSTIHDLAGRLWHAGCPVDGPLPGNG
jgi:hypothetical protein